MPRGIFALLRSLLSPLTAIFLLLLLFLNVGVAEASHFTGPSTKGISEELELGKYYSVVFNKTHYEEYYVLKVTEPGIYFINSCVTFFTAEDANGYLYLEDLAEIYYPWLNKNVTVREIIAKITFDKSYNASWKDMELLFVNTGDLILHWWYTISSEDATVVANFTVEKVVLLKDAQAITGEVSLTLAAGAVKLLKIEATEEEFVNITISGTAHYYGSGIPLTIKMFDEKGGEMGIYSAQFEIYEKEKQSYGEVIKSNFSTTYPTLLYLLPGVLLFMDGSWREFNKRLTSYKDPRTVLKDHRGRGSRRVAI